MVEKRWKLINVTGPLGSHLEKNEVGIPPPSLNLNSTSIKDLYVIFKKMKVLENESGFLKKILFIYF